MMNVPAVPIVDALNEVTTGTFAITPPRVSVTRMKRRGEGASLFETTVDVEETTIVAINQDDDFGWSEVTINPIDPYCGETTGT